MGSAVDTQRALDLALRGLPVPWGRPTHPRQRQPRTVRPGMGKHRPEEAPDPGWKRGGQGGLPRGGEASRNETGGRTPPKSILVASRPTGMQGSTPLDVAAASVIDNNELALALQEQDLEKVQMEETRPPEAPRGPC